MSTTFTRLSLVFLHDLRHQKFSLKFSDFFQFRNSSTRSHHLTLMCKHSRINVYTDTLSLLILLTFGIVFQFLPLPYQAEMLLFLLFVIIPNLVNIVLFQLINYSIVCFCFVSSCMSGYTPIGFAFCILLLIF